MAVTNPNKADFAAWAENRLIGQTDGFIGKGLSNLLAEGLAYLTEAHNYGIFSTYTIPTPDGGEATYIGIFSKFLPAGNMAFNVDQVIGVIGFALIVLVGMKVLRKWTTKDEQGDLKG